MLERLKEYDAGIINGMFALAVFVQLAVYGATRIRSGEGLLHFLAPYFGVPYAILFLGFQFWFCMALNHPRGLRYIKLCWIAYGMLVLICIFLLNRSLSAGTWLSLGAGLSAMVLWAAFHKHRI